VPGRESNPHAPWRGHLILRHPVVVPASVALCRDVASGAGFQQVGGSSVPLREAPYRRVGLQRGLQEPRRPYVRGVEIVEVGVFAPAAASRALLIVSRSRSCDRPAVIEKSILLQRRWARTALSTLLRPLSLFGIGKCSSVGLQALCLAVAVIGSK
jgi:hypothetical protein